MTRAIRKITTDSPTSTSSDQKSAADQEIEEFQREASGT